MAIFVSKREETTLGSPRASQAAGLGQESPRMWADPDASTAGAESFANASAQEEALPPKSERDLTEKKVALSVTRHHEIADVEFETLLSGIDTLDIGVYVSWEDWESQQAFFEEQKLDSQGTNGILCNTDIGRQFLFLPTGKPPQYRFHLQFLEYHIFIAKSGEYPRTPSVFVSFISCAIWHLGINALVDLLECDLSSFGCQIMRIVPSRVDLCVDLKLNAPLSKQFLDLHRVSRSQTTDTIENSGRLESFYCGSTKAEVRVTIYDKGLEIGKSAKQWFLDLWNIEDATNVFRVEFRLKRPFLHKYQIHSLETLRSQLGSMWGYLTTEWFTLRFPDNPETNRRTIHPLWKAIHRYGSEKFGEDVGERRTFKTDNVVPINKILPHIWGRAVTIAALSGIKDRKQSIQHLCELLERHCDDLTFNQKYREKCIKLGYRGKLGGANNDEC